MSNWIIDKSFTFEMGHRVWSQKLDLVHLSISSECACKHLHGHSYTLKVFLEASSLDQSEMVTDFKNLNFMKVFLDSTLDHKFMIDINDPAFNVITGVDPSILTDHHNFDSLSQWIKVSADAQDFVNSFVLVDFVPTSENICRSMFEYAQDKIGSIAKVSSVELWETAKSHCRYSAP